MLCCTSLSCPVLGRPALFHLLSLFIFFSSCFFLSSHIFASIEGVTPSDSNKREEIVVTTNRYEHDVSVSKFSFLLLHSFVTKNINGVSLRLHFPHLLSNNLLYASPSFLTTPPPSSTLFPLLLPLLLSFHSSSLFYSLSIPPPLSTLFSYNFCCQLGNGYSAN